MSIVKGLTRRQLSIWRRFVVNGHYGKAAIRAAKAAERR